LIIIQGPFLTVLSNQRKTTPNPPTVFPPGLLTKNRQKPSENDAGARTTPPFTRKFEFRLSKNDDADKLGQSTGI
jgi:hypothetical protein